MRESGELPRAVDELTIARALSPDCVDFRIELGLAFLQQNKADNSIALLRGVIEEAPDDASAHYSLARALQRSGKAEEAAFEFKEADGLKEAERNRDSAGLYTLNGIHSLQGGKFSEAIESLRQAVALKPDYAGANYYLGIALAQSRDSSGSVRAFHVALEKRPESTEIHYNFGVALRQMGNFPDAIRELRQATELKPEDGLAHCALGLALLHEEDRETGEKELELAHQLGACKSLAAWTLQATPRVTLFFRSASAGLIFRPGGSALRLMVTDLDPI